MCGSIIGNRVTVTEASAEGSHGPTAAVWVKGEMCTRRQDGGIRSSSHMPGAHTGHLPQCPLGISP